MDAPWLRPADPASHFERGFSEAAQAAESNARIGLASRQLEQKASMERMQMEVDKQLAQQRFNREQQQMEISKAYKEAQLGLQNARLGEVKRMNDDKIAQAARKFQARQAYSQAVAGGADPVNAALTNSAALEMPGGSIAALARARDRQARPPASVMEKTYGGKKFVEVTQPSGMKNLHPISEPRTKSDDTNLRWEYGHLSKDAATLRKEMSLGPGKSEQRKAIFEQNRQELDKKQARMKEIEGELGVGKPKAKSPDESADDRVRVMSPDGKVGTLPKSQLEKAMKAGYKQMDAE